MGCAICGGIATYLGTLGCLAWLRCRDCGAEWSVSADDDALLDAEEILGY